MLKFKTIFTQKSCSIIGMIHVDPLPRTPNYVNGSFENVIEKAKHEAHVYQKAGIDSVLIENMHDIPYIKSNQLGPEVVSSMARVACEVKNIFSKQKLFPVGIQILACGSKQALAVAKACHLDYIRNEGYVFAHIGDEGYIESNAGELLRYRKSIDAENVLIFNDIKKKHSSHAITQDVSLVETAEAAKFFLADGLILTGKSTGDTTDVDDLKKLSQQQLGLPILIGSGVTRENLQDYFALSDAIIIGSHFKENGNWKNELSGARIDKFMEFVRELRSQSK